MTQTSTHADRIRRAYADTRPYVTTDYIGFEMLREEAGLSTPQFDAAIRSMLHDSDATIIGESNQKTLSHAQRAAAVMIG
ncbi:MAG: hypothetical protein V4515_14495, partial [Chloroflexota bacterium]